MSAILVPTIKTSYTNFEMIKRFIEGWKKQFNELPQKKSIAVLWAQNAIETGSTISMWNNNIGNVKYAPSKDVTDDVEYMMLSNTWEIINGKKVIYQPPHPATWFRSFESLVDGVSFHLDFLKNHRYKKAWVAVENGNPAEFAHLLKLANYYTAPEADYIRAVNLYFNKFMKDDSFEKVIEILLTPKPIETPIEVTEEPSIINTAPIETQITVPVIPVPVQKESFFQILINLFIKFFSK